MKGFIQASFLTTASTTHRRSRDHSNLGRMSLVRGRRDALPYGRRTMKLQNMGLRAPQVLEFKAGSTAQRLRRLAPAFGNAGQWQDSADRQQFTAGQGGRRS